MQKVHINSIPAELADKVCSIIHEITGGVVNVMGKEGKIISSSNPQRIGSIHEGGAKIMAGECDEIAINREMAAQMLGAKAGYNGLVRHNTIRIGCIGIGGDPDRVKPLQKMAALIISNELQQLEELEKRMQNFSELSGQIKDIAERMGILSLNGSIQAARLGQLGNPFKIVASEMRTLSEEIETITETMYSA